MARKPSTKTLVPDLPDQPDPAKMYALEHTEFEDAPESIDGVYAVATTSVITVTGIEAETHLSSNQKGQPRVGMRLGTFRRITDYLMHLDVTNVALRSAVSDLHENLADSERQRAELKDATVNAATRIAELEQALVETRASAPIAAEITPVAAELQPTVNTAAVDELRVKVNDYRSRLATQRGGAEALLAFDDVFLAANKI